MSGQRTRFRRLVFWEPIVSPHKHFLFEALAQMRPDLQIVCVADAPLSEDRRRLGWTVPEAGRHQQIVAPDPASLRAIVAEGGADSLHLFSGIRWVPVLTEGLKQVRALGLPFAIQSEPRCTDGWRGQLRRAHSLLTERALAREVSLVLAIGRHGPPWFRSVGYAADKIFPFAYFVPPPQVGQAASVGDSPEASAEMAAAAGGLESITDRPPTIGYLGRLEPQKGVQYLMPALAQMRRVYDLIIAGAGSLAPVLQAEAASFAGRVSVQGPMAITEVGKFLAAVDVLVLPSTTTDDGWGVVVSEALMCGCAVVVSERAGASIVADIDANGVVIAAHSSEAIATAVDRLIDDDRLSLQSRERRRAWARRHLDAAAGARNLNAILGWIEAGGTRPAAFYANEAG